MTYHVKDALFRAIGWLAISCFAVVGTIHVASLAGTVPSAASSILFDTFPILALAAIAYIIAARRADDELRVPVWAIASWLAAMIYSGINFENHTKATRGGHVEVVNGHTALVAHGRVLQLLSPSEARAIEVWEVRGTSGHLLPFFLITGLGLLVLVPSSRNAEGTRRTA